LSLSGSVDLPEIDNSPGFSRLLPHYVHTTAPGGRGITWDSLEHPEGDILFEIPEYLVQPVGRDCSGLVDSDRFCSWLQEKA
jgi:hypothetical protein